MRLNLSERKTKIVVSIVTLLTLVIILMGPKPLRNFFLHTSWDQGAETYLKEGLVKAGVAFGISRTINAAVSVAQDTDISFEPGGVGVAFSPGQTLDPLNDMLERFSSVMFFSMTLLGIQEIMVSLFPAMAWWVVMPFLLLVFLGNIWISAPKKRFGNVLGTKLLLFVILLRFFMPIEITAVSFLDKQCLRKNYESNITEVQAIQGNIKKMDEQPTKVENDQGFWDNIQQKLDITTKMTNISQSVDSLTSMAENLFTHLIVLSAIFLLQTLLLPLGGAALIYFGGKKVLTSITTQTM